MGDPIIHQLVRLKFDFPIFESAIRLFISRDVLQLLGMCHDLFIELSIL